VFVGYDVTVLGMSIVQHLETKLLIGDSQHGFRKGRSCLTNLLSFLDKITSYVDSGDNVDVVFLDFAKTFDKVPHKRLTFELESHVLMVRYCSGSGSGCEIECKECVSVVRYHHAKGIEWRPIPGSVLGPILFLIYINDLDNGIQSWILKFADGAKIFSAVNNLTVILIEFDSRMI